ncbi:TPA: hypothetical protein MMJ96_003498 [Clostridium botulinum]|nr:hypothetical protein [Clostridium botulinum]HBZ6638298.1 hypothetical protein [Clostridium botulinum]HBZ7132763.1 hypothetical protein [Clostridium botulinum]
MYLIRYNTMKIEKMNKYSCQLGRKINYESRKNKEMKKIDIINKGIDLIKNGPKEVACDSAKEVILKNDQKQKIKRIEKNINSSYIDEDVKEKINDYIQKDIYKNIIIFDDEEKNELIEDFFKKNNNCIIYKSEIENIFNNYFQEVEEYKKRILLPSDKLIFQKIKQDISNNRTEHKSINQAIKETGKNVIEEIKKRDKMGMISIEEKEKIEFRIQYVDENPDHAMYNFFGCTVDFTNLYETSSKLMMKIKIKNVGTDFLHNIIVKNFQINNIDGFENDSYNLTEVCSYKDEQSIKNIILPGTNSQINFIFDVFNGLNIDGYEEIFQELTERLDISFSFDIKLNNEKTITQEFQIYCSRIDDGSKRYLIDSVTNTFEINEE